MLRCLVRSPLLVVALAAVVESSAFLVAIIDHLVASFRMRLFLVRVPRSFSVYSTGSTYTIVL